MKNIRRYIALCILPAFLFLFLSDCETTGQQSSGRDEDGYGKNMEASVQLRESYLANHNRELPEGVASLAFDWQGNLVFFLEPNYDGLEEAIREEMGDASFTIEYCGKFTPRYLQTAKAKVDQYLAGLPEGGNPLGILEPSVDESYFNRVVVPVSGGWSEERDKALREAIGPQADAVFILWGESEFMDTAAP